MLLVHVRYAGDCTFAIGRPIDARTRATSKIDVFELD
jgi:hypothetical protein